MRTFFLFLLLLSLTSFAQRDKAREQFLDTVPVFAVQKPETLVAKPFYSIFDFDFADDKLILLTAEHSLKSARVELSDYSGKIFASFQVPRSAGAALRLFHDFEGYTDLVCQDSVFCVDVMNNQLLVSTIPLKTYKNYLLRVEDTLNLNTYFQDRIDIYPQFSYYFVNHYARERELLATVCNQDLLKLYNMEYYFLSPGDQLAARRLAALYNADVHLVAAMMSGFTRSLFYEPLYAPLFILNDTICLFNHHADRLYHYSSDNRLIDSVKISYHHPKKWREWKKQLFVDKAEGRVYAFFSRDGHHYLKRINHRTGLVENEYKLKHHSAERIKIRDGYVYYVYRPFDSTQERFLYRERIN